MNVATGTLVGLGVGEATGEVGGAVAVGDASAITASFEPPDQAGGVT